jgi:antitoxin VapB
MGILAISSAKHYLIAHISTRKIMSEPQLFVRSTKAKDLAHALARRTGQPINRLVELALERYDNELRQQSHPLDAVWELAAEGQRDVLAGTTSAHDDLYDEDGLPK